MANTVPQGSIGDLWRQSFIMSTAVPGQIGLVMLNPDGSTISGGGGGMSIGGAITGATAGSVLFANASSQLAQDNNNFYFQDSATTPTQLATNTNVALSINTGGDFTGTDAINIYAQVDAYLPNSAITAGVTGLTTDGATPGFTASTSRGTGPTPTISLTGDQLGQFGLWFYTGASPAYTPGVAISGSVSGSTSANLGATLAIWTKADGGVLTQNLTLSNAGLLGIGGITSPAARLHFGSSYSSAAWTTNGIGLRVDSATYTDTTSSGTVAEIDTHVINPPTFAFSNATTVTNASTLFVGAGPSAGTNATITTAWSAIFNGRVVINAGGGNAVGLIISPSNSYSGTNGVTLNSSFNGSIGLGTGPSAKIHISGNASSAAWTTNGIMIRADSATYTDTSSSGSVAQVNIINIGSPTIAANSATTYTVASTLNISNPPTNGTNVTILQGYAITTTGRNYFVGNSNTTLAVGQSIGSTATGIVVNTTNTGLLGIGTIPAAKLHINGAITAAAWTTSGIGIRSDSATYTDSSSSGTVGTQVVHAITQPTIAASSSTTYTNTATLYIPSAPAAGTNVTISNAWALWVGSGGGTSRFDATVFCSSNVGIGTGNSVQDAFLYLVNGRTTTGAFGVRGKGIMTVTGTYTDGVTTTGTITNGSVHSLDISTMAFASGAATITNATTLYIAGAPTAGTGATITNGFAARLLGMTQITGISEGYSNPTTTYTVLPSDDFIAADTTAGAFTATFPTTGIVSGKRYTIMRINTGINNLTIGATVNGSTNPSISTQYGKMTIVFNGTTYYQES